MTAVGALVLAACSGSGLSGQLAEEPADASVDTGVGREDASAGADTGTTTDGGGDAGEASAEPPDAGPRDAGPDAQCVANEPCAPSDPCRVGATSCSGGNASCVAAGNKSAGTSCGKDQVCDASGGCVACVAGAACAPANPCRVGVTSCLTGAQTCVETGASQPDNTACGGGKICKAGVCSAGTCVAGQACTPANPCHVGTTACPGGPAGAATCSDTGAPAAAGTACGASSVCNAAGACTACTPGAACTPGTCRSGQMSCASGPVCTDTGAAPVGATCGANQVCDDKQVCSVCNPGAACSLTGQCVRGAIACGTGHPVCTATATPVPDGTNCGPSQYCNAGTCRSCTPGGSCNPPGSCKLGTYSCATGLQVCEPGASNQPNGTSCGANLVCNNGACEACTAGGACTSATVDPCALGTYSCATGKQLCVAGGADPTKNGKACGASSTGTCAAGRCQCPGGQAFYQGDCQVCPAFTGGSVYVNADPSKGLDNACCGRTNTPGFAGPCLTVAQGIAIATTAATPLPVNVTGDAAGNLHASEPYPIVLRKGVSVGGGACAPGAAGQPVVTFAADGTTSYFAGGTLGATCQGVSAGATVGVYVGPGATGQLGGVSIRGVPTGIQIDGGTLGATSPFIQDVTVGLLCRSDANTGLRSTLKALNAQPNSVSVQRASKFDVLASRGCTMTTTSFTLGESTCANSKRDAYGLYVEGDAAVSLAGYNFTATCMANDAVSLRTNAGFPVNAPTVVLGGGRIARSGCYGAYAEVGKLTMSGGMLVSHNHWGVVQRSSATSSDPAASLINLSGTNGARNMLVCNNATEPGACCTGASCPAGASLWNNSGLVLNADNNYFDTSPLSKCTCDASLQSCTCSGAAFGSTTPPDGTSVVNAPLPPGTTAGTTSTNNYALAACQ